MRSGPSFVPPQLPTLVEQPPEGEEWTHEIKYDGYRSQIVLDCGKVTIYTQHGQDWTKRYQYVADRAAETLNVETAVLDGEMAAMDGKGKTNIMQLRLALDTYPGRLIFIAFDLLHLNGKDLRNEPLCERRAALAQLLRPIVGPVLYGEDVDVNAARFYDVIQRLGMEGIVSKRRDGTYFSGQSQSWVTTKSFVEAEFSIAGVRRLPSGSMLALLATESGEYVGTANVSIPTGQHDILTDRIEAGGRKSALGARSNVWGSAPGLSGKVRFLRGEGYLRHATLTDLRPIDPSHALNAQIEQREAVQGMLAKLSSRERPTLRSSAMANQVSSQLAQRTAVRMAKEQALVRVASSSFGRRSKLYLVYMEGEPYIADDRELASLRNGATPAELELPQPVDENEPFSGYT